ncbi:hypothetical protein [Leptospira idonii]|uniref:DUF4145 domain-containing protein n=1 Tax=Leptospira idonii TaxID=1193500 RepID=A0A4R9LWK9_9LEPT|nr:hypothetical protein [Leptospira idonii]TGN17783.1 hypothetical protein EHS15_16085 [Leptospira idonii]
MPEKKFLEEYPLYKKYAISSIAATLDLLPKPAILMYCEICKENHTFNMTNHYWDGFHYTNVSCNGLVVKLEYLCMHCQKEDRLFFIKIANDKKWLMKIGQYPAWEIRGDRNIEKMLHDFKDYFKKGLVCESQGYGIGAFGYYRRIVEEILDQLLDEISLLLSGEDLNQYNVALQKTKQTIVAQEKIELVKELLPPILRPNNMNPLQILHSALSEGLHARSDEECLEYSDQCRSIIIFLVNQIQISKNSAKDFSESMKKVLDKKKG